MSEHQRLIDADLIAHLRRRTASQRGDSDLSVPAFVAGVDAKIDAAPTPSVRSRMPALVGVAGAAAIVLVLVVAGPRLGPGNASPRPTPETPPSTITARGVASFAARLASGELDGQTLLIVGEIITEVRFGPVCPIAQDSLCYVGTLAGSEIDLHARPVPTIDGQGSEIPVGESSWRSWRLPSAPTGIARTMAVSVNSDGVVELLGYTPPEEIGSALSEIQYMDFDAMPPDEIRVVPAWLAGIESIEACLEAPSETQLSGLPLRDPCADVTWLTDDRVRLSLTDATPPAGSLHVQNRAYRQYVENPQITDGSFEPRAGAYLIGKRLEGGGCPDSAPPCWQWEVIGRLTAINDGNLAEPLPTTTPVASALQVDCSGQGEISVVDRTGLVTACNDLGVIDRHTQTNRAANPDGDLTRLHFDWGTNICVERGGADVEVFPSGDRYTVLIRERWDRSAENCNLPGARAFELTMSRATHASMVDLVISPMDDESPPPTPNNATTFQCVGPPSPPGMTPAPGPIPVVVDETGLIESCAQTDLTGDLVPPISLTALDDRTIHVAWQNGICDAAIVFTFSAFPDDSYGLHGKRPHDCADGSEPLPLQITFRQPVPADQVHTSLIDGPVAGLCSHSVTEIVLPLPTFVDETGLVESCISVDLAEWRFPIPVVDFLGEKRLHVNWTGTECSTNDRVTFAPSGDRYTVTLIAGGSEDCEPVARRRLMLVFREPYDMTLIDWAGTDTHRSCPYSEQPERSEVEVVDRFGIVARCEAFLTSDAGPSEVDVSSTDGDPSHLTISWQVNHVCNSNPARLQLWGPQPVANPSDDAQSDYDIWIDRLEPTEQPTGCRESIGTQGVRLELSQRTGPDIVRAFLAHDGVGERPRRNPPRRLCLHPDSRRLRVRGESAYPRESLSRVPGTGALDLRR